MYDRILVPTDGSRGTAHVAMQAFDLAERYGAAVHLLYVVDDDFGPMLALTSKTRAELRDRGDLALATLMELARAFHLEPVSEIRDGDPAHEILAYADEIDADAIVMGTHGRSGIERRLIGSVAERVVRNADRPVMTIRLPASNRTVTDGPQAERIAEEALDAAGFDNVAIEGSTQQPSVWVIEATADGSPNVVYVDPVTQRTSIVRQARSREEDQR